MSFIRPSLTQLAERARADLDAWLPGADSRLRSSVLDVLAARVHSGGMHGLYGELDWVARQIFASSSDEDGLETHARGLGIQRKPAVAASGNASVTGVNGAIIDVGALLSRSDGARYTLTSAAQIVGGTSNIAVAAEIAGTEGNGLAGQVLTFINPVPGVNAQVSILAPGFVSGTAQESAASLLERYLFRRRNPPSGGKLSDYVAWAREVPGVTRAWAYAGWLGAGSVGLGFVMDGRTNPIPLPADVAAVQAHIDAERPVAGSFTAFSPLPVPVNLVIAATPPSADVEAAITAEVTDLLFREAEPNGRLLISHIREAISIAPGEFDHILISPVANMQAGAGEMFVMGAISWA